MAVSEVRHTIVTNSKNGVLRIGFIDQNVQISLRKKGTLNVCLSRSKENALCKRKLQLEVGLIKA